jgi:hypothetical protein
MKKMKKMKLIACSFLLFVGMNSYAQKEAGATVGLLKPDVDGAKSIYGINVFGKKQIKDKIRAGLNIGYYSESEGSVSLSIIPISGLVEYKFNENTLSPYLGGEVGVFMETYSSNLSVNSRDDNSSTNLAFAPVAGFDYKINDDFKANVNAKYQFVKYEGITLNYLGFNVGVVYNLK